MSHNLIKTGLRHDSFVSYVIKPRNEHSFNNNTYCGINTCSGNVLFNDALNTFYLRLYGVGTCSDSEKNNNLQFTKVPLELRLNTTIM